MIHLHAARLRSRHSPWSLQASSVSGLAKVPGLETVKTLVSIAMCYSFNEELKCRTSTQYAILPYPVTIFAHIRVLHVIRDIR